MHPGTVIDRYVVEEELGRGGLAVVYRVRHRTLGTRHALKVLSVPRRSIRERLLQEGILQARLKHPHIVAVTDVLDLDEGPGLLLEYVDGGTLEDLLERGPLSLHEAERLFRGVLDGVAFAHAHATVHRDLKPANVLLAPSPDGPVPKVADFGLAKVLDDDDALPDRKATRTGVTMGTPAYMAPEQVRDAKHVDERADVFALGCILYELVTGRVAFEGPDVLTIFNRIVSGDFPPLDRVDPAVPDRVRDAIEGALRVDPAQRLPTVEALRAVLDGHGPPPIAPRDTFLPEDADGPAPRPPSRAALAGALGVGLALASAGLAARWVDLAAPPDPAPAAVQASAAPAGELPPPLPTRPLPRCDALPRCLHAGARADGPFGERMAASMAESIPTVQQMARMDGMGGFDADERCAMMIDAWRRALAHLRGAMEVPDACP